MAESSDLDRAYHFVLTTFMERGDPPHFTELAKHFGAPPEQAKALLRELVATGIPCWLYPDTDYIAAWAPFNAQPTQYRLFVDGKARGYAQCGFEALAVCWLFPDRTITIRAPCLDCGEPMFVEVRNGKLQRMSDPAMVSYVDIPFREWRPTLAYS
jgi:hypothetical protein